MASQNPPKCEETTPASTSTTATYLPRSQNWGNIQGIIDSSTSGIAQVTRRVTGAGDYFRNTILANVERLAGDAAIADEKERLARTGYQQMRGRPEEHTHTPPISEYYAPHNVQANQQHGTTTGSTVPPGYVEPTKPGYKN
ncbi:hypothetical protein TWF102_000344 [Orbilia oligospora]|uniref:Uncharacterized protein n=1 Tax=Orbilia oligospora TaxID=2813651 RepID=A0A7C8NZP1_ORBOL|nr:hypothetical protein TWF102_000344 [Orbilia oligospora]KAF3113800.1 hypothetical protein TWF706_009171 [Orbilia oligospora]KAF3115958.1 hypothetical protein TWF103_010184 [Orbilia oligospora]KAF3138222.1 hypothetical protein TWF703_004751 [Orbilia oligospora]